MSFPEGKDRFEADLDLKALSLKPDYYELNNCLIIHVPDEDKSNESDPDYQLHFLSDGESDDTEHYPEIPQEMEDAKSSPIPSQEMEIDELSGHSVNIEPKFQLKRNFPPLTPHSDVSVCSYLDLEHRLPIAPENRRRASFHQLSDPNIPAYQSHSINNSIKHRNNFTQKFPSNAKPWIPPRFRDGNDFNSNVQSNSFHGTSFQPNENANRNNWRQNSRAVSPGPHKFEDNGQKKSFSKKFQNFCSDEDRLSGYKSEGEIEYNKKADFRSKKFSHSVKMDRSFHKVHDNNPSFHKDNNYQPPHAVSQRVNKGQQNFNANNFQENKRFPGKQDNYQSPNTSWFPHTENSGDRFNSFQQNFNDNRNFFAARSDRFRGKNEHFNRGRRPFKNRRPPYRHNRGNFHNNAQNHSGYSGFRQNFSQPYNDDERQNMQWDEQQRPHRPY